MTREAIFAADVRSPFAFARKGGLAAVRPDDPGAHVIRALLARTGVAGGGIAFGPPLGATGGRLIGKAATLLQRTGGRYGLATQCIGGGMGIAMVLEALR